MKTQCAADCPWVDATSWLCVLRVHWCMQVGILQKMQSCRNTVRLLGCYESNDEVMVVTGLCSGGDLQKLSDVSPGSRWKRLARCSASQQLDQFHQQQQQHRKTDRFFVPLKQLNSSWLPSFVKGRGGRSMQWQLSCGWMV